VQNACKSQVPPAFGPGGHDAVSVLRTLLAPDKVATLGERMEEDEHKVLGDEGFERYVDQVAALENQLGIAIGLPAGGRFRLSQPGCSRGSCAERASLPVRASCAPVAQMDRAAVS
jgi:hypothetical protein